MSVSLAWEPLTLHLRNPFRLSYGVTDSRRTFVVRLEEAGATVGLGEAAMPPYYGVSDEQIEAVFAAAARRTGSLPDDLAAIPAWLQADPPLADGPSAARNALDLALHDRIGAMRGLPLHALLGLPRPPTLPTSFTIAIADPDEMARLAGEAQGYTALKIKLGSDDDFTRLAAVRAARPDVKLRVDANAGWQAEDAVPLIRRLESLDIELVEQPTGRHDFAGLGYVQQRVGVPVVADESCQSLADIEAIAAAGVQGINLKLMKAGGLAPAVAMLRRARELGLRVMLGCMIETSIAVTAVAHLAHFAEWLDLDGPLLISNDPFAGLTYDAAGCIHVPVRPGIGVTPR